MGKKMKLPSLPKTTEPPSWPWPACGTPKTLSFRAGNDVFKTINSAYIDDTPLESRLKYGFEKAVEKSDDHLFCDGESTSEDYGCESVEAVIRGLRSGERLFCEPGTTSSILEQKKAEEFPFKESVVMAMDSMDPFVDFRSSMEEMVEAHGLKDWDCLQELLSWYLRVNGRGNHGYIVGAFVDLLVGLAFGSCTTTSTSSYSNGDDDHSLSVTTRSPTSALSFSSSTPSTSLCLSSLEAEDQDEREKKAEIASSQVGIKSIL
ncbi:hypothetical protein RJ640_014118 [Escallonia rubra]|uniref:Transcription repressor n=1 Tax=Escallonia rubra TaxID=112253 RepID=A0AA88U0J5_9ASTE|nr:hypothetical protein RJ640_014118 [Escallonia rubra]